MAAAALSSVDALNPQDGLLPFGEGRDVRRGRIGRESIAGPSHRGGAPLPRSPRSPAVTQAAKKTPALEAPEWPRDGRTPRPPTPQLVDRAAELRRHGYSVEGIAERLDVSRRTTERALALAREEPPRLEVVRPAPSPEVANEASLVATIERASTGDWRAAAWLLERLNPAKWTSPRARGRRRAVSPRPLRRGRRARALSPRASR
jgi:hypothetical protein